MWLFIIEVLGFLAALSSFVVWFPQGVKVWRGRNDPRLITGVSIPTQIMMIINNLLWASYGLATGALWVGAPVVINVPMGILTIVLLRRARSIAPGVVTDQTIADELADIELTDALTEMEVRIVATSSEDDLDSTAVAPA